VAAAAVLATSRWVSHHDPDRAADAKVDLRQRRLPAPVRVPPPPQHLDARPSVEYLLGRGVEGPLDPEADVFVR
jgi:hypothetical protein